MNTSVGTQEERNKNVSCGDTNEGNVCTKVDSSYSFSSLQDAIMGAGEWYCSVICKGYSITDPMNLKDHNICQFVVRSDVALPTNMNYSDVKCWMGSTFKFDSNTFSGADHRHQLKNYVLDACARSGFKAEAEVKLVKPTTNHPNPSKTATIRIRCCYNKVPLSQLPPKSEGMF